MTLLEYLNEEFLDKPVKFIKIDDLNYSFEIEDEKFRVRFYNNNSSENDIESLRKNGVTVGFGGPGIGRSKNYEMTKKVFSTIYKIINDFITINKIKTIYFGGSPIKKKFYTFLAKEFIKKNKHYTYNIKDDNYGFKITVKKL